MPIGQPNFEPSSKLNMGKTPRQMMAELALIFHPDREAQGGGDLELAKELNQVYDLAKSGKPDKLIKMYKDWTEGKPDDAKVMSLKKVQEILEQKSNELFKLAKRKPNIFAREPRILKEKYLELCEQYGIKPDRDFLKNFLYDQGWINEKELENYDNIIF